MRSDIYSYLATMGELTRSPETDWKNLLGEEVHKLLEPKWTEYKTVESKWELNPHWDFVLTTLATIHFADDKLLAPFYKTIENIKEMEV